MSRPAKKYGNTWSRLSAAFTAQAHVRAPAFRWAVLSTLFIVWLIAGYFGWAATIRAEVAGGGSVEPAEALYRTFSALSIQEAYFLPDNGLLHVARFAGLAVPAIGLLFAFSGSLGRSLARIFFGGAVNHIVIAGSSEPALSLAQDCDQRGDSVVVIGRGIPEETAWSLGERGVALIVGEATRLETLRQARAHRAAHVVAFEDDDSANLQIEAVMRRLVERERRRKPIAVHVATRSPMLLQEAREMRSLEQAKRDAVQSKGQANPPPALDPKPFALDELAARALIQQESATILTLAEKLKHPRPHLLLFGFDDAAEAVAVRALASLWSARLEAPRITVCTPHDERCEARFKARYPQAVSHANLWVADISFRHFDGAIAVVDTSLLDAIARDRGPITAILVSTGVDADNILLALALKRSCNQEFAHPAPIYMRETSQSEFSRQYAKGDDTPELDAYLQAFGSHQTTATRQFVIDGRLDRGAAVAHEYYRLGFDARDQVDMKDLQAAARGWDEVRETYRAANRASADSAMVKLWDAGWRPASRAERAAATTEPGIPDDVLAAMAKREHDRWTAERLLAGWRPGAKRNNEQRVHPNLKPWEQLTVPEQDRDKAQVHAAIDIGRMMHRSGFVKREMGAAAA